MVAPAEHGDNSESRVGALGWGPYSFGASGSRRQMSLPSALGVGIFASSGAERGRQRIRLEQVLQIAEDGLPPATRVIAER